ncbi:MAG TPA: potassium channel family protein [Ktedonobacteraceae bacterium]|jgi:hypothetical protein|nr:potassium channel family protein [Ktedonobacteraceae bacterium]
MRILAAIVGILFVLLILQDCVETIVLPRRVARRFRFASLFYRITWRAGSFFVRHIRSNNRREYVISFYGPLSLLLLLICWACGLILAVALIHFGIGSRLQAPEKVVTFWTDLYLSGTTFFTLGLGDVTPLPGIARLIVILEGGLGFGFLALVIGYVPVIYQAFSHREALITTLDARAGSPPSAVELLRRHMPKQDPVDLIAYLRNWEFWCTEVLESHLSYPVLMYYRSQHERESWPASLTTILDVSALVMVGIDSVPEQVGRFTFAIARHAAVDLTQTLYLEPAAPVPDRLTSKAFLELSNQLAEMGIYFNDPQTAEIRLKNLRHMYEPYVNVLARHLLTSMPDWIAVNETIDDWQTSPWDHFAFTTQRPYKKISQ